MNKSETVAGPHAEPGIATPRPEPLAQPEPLAGAEWGAADIPVEEPVIPQARARSADRPRSGGGSEWLTPALVYGGTAVLGAMMYRGKQVAEAEKRHPPLGRFLEVDGTTLHYTDIGSGPPVVLLHGAAATLDDWFVSGVVEPLLRFHRVITVDRPGYGYSRRPGGTRWTPERQARAIAMLLHRLGAHDAVVVGHSIGVFPAMALALQHAPYVRGLVLVGGPYLPGSAMGTVARFIPSVPLVGPLARQTLTPMVARSGLQSMLRSMFEPHPVTRDFKRLFPFDLIVRPGQLHAMLEDLGMVESAARRFLPYYQDFRCEVTVVTGSGDAIVHPDRQARAFADMVPQANLVVIPGGGHMAHHVAPLRMTTLIMDTYAGDVVPDELGPEPDFRAGRLPPRSMPAPAEPDPLDGDMADLPGRTLSGTPDDMADEIGAPPERRGGRRATRPIGGDDSAGDLAIPETLRDEIPDNATLDALAEQVAAELDAPRPSRARSRTETSSDRPRRETDGDELAPDISEDEATDLSDIDRPEEDDGIGEDEATDLSDFDRLEGDTGGLSDEDEPTRVTAAVDETEEDATPFAGSDDDGTPMDDIAPGNRRAGGRARRAGSSSALLSAPVDDTEDDTADQALVNAENDRGSRDEGEDTDEDLLQRALANLDSDDEDEPDEDTSGLRATLSRGGTPSATDDEDSDTDTGGSSRRRSRRGATPSSDDEASDDGETSNSRRRTRGASSSTSDDTTEADSAPASIAALAEDDEEDDTGADTDEETTGTSRRRGRGRTRTAEADNPDEIPTRTAKVGPASDTSALGEPDEDDTDGDAELAADDSDGASDEDGTGEGTDDASQTGTSSGRSSSRSRRSRSRRKSS